ncbi:MAG: ATP-dependent helicase HrpB [Inquilinaceae bacterium]
MAPAPLDRTRLDRTPADALPIEAVLPALRRALADGSAAVLEAPPGAGKTTRVPLALLDEPWLAGGTVLVLEPRRLAARAAARRMASTLGEPVGATVGYRVRLDRKIGPKTRIEVITDGILTRRIQADPALRGVAAVLFDEFHERSLQVDLGLALCLDSQAALRPDLRLLIMSATLDGAPAASLLGDAPVIASTGRAYPVETRYRAPAPNQSPEASAAAAVRLALADETGDILVFLPGAREIRRVASLLSDVVRDGVAVTPLYGDLPASVQDRAIRPSAEGGRKVVLATAIAETSLTIEGVRVVVDAGYSRAPVFAPRRGMSRLETVRVSRASADQRRGRAGRLGPGVCYRLWAETADRALVPFTPPEILTADLAPLALDLAEWGVSDATSLRWLDAPPSAALDQARDLLARLGALDRDGRITGHGRAMQALPLHPRLADMTLRARDLGLGDLAADVAALLEERDPLPGRDADFRRRVEALRRPGAAPDADVGVLRRARASASQIARLIGAGPSGPRGGARADDGAAEVGLLLAFAYPDRIAQRRPGGRGQYLLSNGAGAVLAPDDPLASEPYLAVADVDGGRREARIYRAAPLGLDQIETHFADQIDRVDHIGWDTRGQAVEARRQRRLGALVLADDPLADPDPDAVAAAMLEGVRLLGPGCLPWTKASLALRRRVAFLRNRDAEGAGWPDLSDTALAAGLSDWLLPHLAGCRRVGHLAALDLTAILHGTLSWDQRQALAARAPDRIAIPTGARLAVEYTDPAAPVLAVRLQDLFGLNRTPAVDGGRMPLTLHLLSPAGRPLQVTRDLPGFWASSYAEVRKEMRGRYPKHHWPEDPTSVEPGAGPRRRR